MRLKISADGRQIFDTENVYKIGLIPGVDSFSFRGSVSKGGLQIRFFGNLVSHADPRVLEVFPRCRAQDLTEELRQVIAEAISLQKPSLVGATGEFKFSV